jgi:hypothetical protein
MGGLVARVAFVVHPDLEITVTSFVPCVRAATRVNVARPVHFSFPSFTLECSSEAEVTRLLGALTTYRAAARKRLGCDSKHFRRISQRGDGLVLPVEARNHYQVLDPQPEGVHRATIASVLAMFALASLTWQ